MVVMFSDRYLSIKRGNGLSDMRSNKIVKFFKIIERFPPELQMLICKRIYNSKEPLTPQQVHRYLMNEFEILRGSNDFQPTIKGTKQKNQRRTKLPSNK